MLTHYISQIPILQTKNSDLKYSKIKGKPQFRSFQTIVNTCSTSTSRRMISEPESLSCKNWLLGLILATFRLMQLPTRSAKSRLFRKSKPVLTVLLDAQNKGLIFSQKSGKRKFSELSYKAPTQLKFPKITSRDVRSLSRSRPRQNRQILSAGWARRTIRSLTPSKLLWEQISRRES